VTDLIHGPAATQEAIRASEILFGGGLEGISEATFKDIVGEVPTKKIAAAKFSGQGMSLIELLVESGLATSKGQGRKDIEGGGINLNNTREANIQRLVSSGDLLFGKYLLLRKGKKNYCAVELE
jgi:tyrosyl-tRNA synthetase